MASLPRRKMATEARRITTMIKLGKVSSQTKGPVIFPLSEDVERKVAGSIYPPL